MTVERRPDPDALLERVKEEEARRARGKLTLPIDGIPPQLGALDG